VEPSRQTVLGEFQAKNLAYSGNDLRDFFQEMKRKTGRTAWLSGNILDYHAGLPENG